MAPDPISHTEHRVPDTGLWRPTSTTHEEVGTDLEQYLRPLEQAHAGALHGWGVATGLSVLATPGYATVRVSTGVAVDSAGRHVVITAGEQVEVSADVAASGELNSSQLVDVGADGVDLSTLGRNGACVLTVQWRETFDRQLLNDSFQQTFVTRHTPWLRVDPVADVPADGIRVVLAALTLDAAGLVLAGGVSVQGRRGLATTVGELRIAAPAAVASGGGVNVTASPAGQLGAGASGGLALRLADAAGSLTIGGPTAGTGQLSIEAAQVSAHRADGSAALLLDVAAGSLTIGGSLTIDNPGGGAPLLSVQPDGGNVGIGTANPTAKLQVRGGAIMPEIGNSPAAGIYFPPNPGGGGGDEGYIRYYPTNGETTKLVIGTGNDADDSIGLVQAGAERLTVVNGNVGIGTTAPDRMLTVVNGARLNLVVVGTTADGADYPWAYESVGVGPGCNLRLQTLNSIFFHTGNPPTANASIDAIGRIGTAGWSPTPRTPGWGGGVHTWDVEAEGTIWSRNDVIAKRFVTAQGDVAENFPAEGDLEPGDVVCLSADGERVATSSPDRAGAVLGVVSTQPALLLKEPESPKPEPAERMVPVALCGRVPCKVTAEGGPIRLGDLLAVSATPGHARRVRLGEAGAAGTVLGKALGRLDSGRATIDVLIALG